VFSVKQRRQPGITAVALALATGGCVLDRVLETHRQLCDASPSQIQVSGAAGEGYRVEFARPTLTREDVEWLVGLPPTRVVPELDGVRLVYVASPTGRAALPGESLATELVFRNVDGVPKLAATLPPARLSSVMPRELVDRSLEAACRAEISLVPPGARFDITAVQVAQLPDAARIAYVLGAPHVGDTAMALYRYCLEPCDPAARPIAQLDYRFGPDGRLTRAKFDYFRYALTVDPKAGVATISLRLP
jgi:hypothetical protein